jgi:hypothetical protein
MHILEVYIFYYSPLLHFILLSFFFKLHIYMMEFYSGREVKIVFSSFCFPVEFWTTFF